ncbi:SppA Periplasmic serine proteases (ClpP class) [uncultured Caudovirales phage]|uniref:SppA Periplasmic serine proteases (ClpP class) n=1 Tax=uncultured Caudovirales phage TaxID=2100421 RepID=A0A6J7WIQ1_9CAUD|nr:SppA Periplasmic serine proteases (ClpP class) [uncultured Caudovirales phage]
MKTLSKDFTSNRPLLIQASVAKSYLDRIAKVETPLTAKMSDMSEMLQAIFGKKETLQKFPPYAIVPVKGVISKNISELESLCGACDIHCVEEMLEECERDQTIECVILDIDSPGGTSVGVPELADMVKNFSKKTISFTSNECCSAAYWIASQAAEFYATPSSCVGSIGVYIAYPDLSKAYEMEGVKMDVIKSGTYKGAGIEGTSLDTNQRKMLQDDVIEIHNEFKAAIKSVRSFVEDASMEGQTFSGKRAAEAGLVTGIVNGFDALMTTLNADVQAQMEADEENDQREEESENENDDEDETAKMSAGDRALGRIAKSVIKPVSENVQASKKKNDDDEDEKDGDQYAKAEKGDDDDDTEGETEPAADSEGGDDGEEASDDAKQDAEDEADKDSDAIDTDEKHDRTGTKRNRSKNVS